MPLCFCTDTKLCNPCRDRAEREWERDGVMPPEPVDSRLILRNMWDDVLTGPSVEEERTYGRHRSFGDFLRAVVESDMKKPPQPAATLLDRAPELSDVTEEELREAWEDAA